MPPKKLKKTDDKELLLLFNKNNNNVISTVGPSHETSKTVDVESNETEGEEKQKKIRKFQDKKLGIYSWLRYEKDGGYMFCQVCEDGKAKNAMVKQFKNTNFQNSTLMRHSELADHVRYTLY